MADNDDKSLTKKQKVSAFCKSLCFWKKEKPPETERKIKANDPEYNASQKYASNVISTSKYNLINFLPKNLFEQFQRLANAYFLFLVILQLIPEISSLPPQTTVIPLVAVLAVSAVKDAVDDIQRHRSDNEVNNRKSMVLRQGKLVVEPWQRVVVGDVIKMENGQFVAADLLILSTSEPNSLCFIDTAELDGETNLKVKQALTVTAELQDDLSKMAAFKGEIQCEAPNNNLNKFEGVLKLRGEEYSLDNEKVLLRGCVLRNTQWCYGLVLFAGNDTKLMMNSGKVIFKRTHMDRSLDILVLGNLIFLLALCLFCMICCGIWESVVGYSFQAYLPWEVFVPGSREYRNPVAAGATVISILVFFSYIILLSAVVPISLYVSVEMIRFSHSWWINWDKEMYYERTDMPAKARTTTLNEELGQIEYIFSDKTGTLTQNIMTFNKLSINGQSFGGPFDRHGPVEKEEFARQVDLSFNRYAEDSFVWYDQRVIDNVLQGEPHCHQFFRLLALCHTVMATEKDGHLEYQAQSPDENALVSAARNFGFVFKSRTPDTITISVNGQIEEHELLCILDFNNVRKRMSVILRRDNKITLYCKGADTLVYERLDPACGKMKDVTGVHLNEFAGAGLRTLCLATKDIDPAYFADWRRRFHAASTSLVDREDKVTAVYEEIEKNMTLIGATAIEDKLQDGVPDTIASLALAGIKIWVLTGDKQETAINIGYCCKLLSDDLEEIYIVDGDSPELVEEQLAKAKEDMIRKIAAARSSNGGAMGDSNGFGGAADEVMYSVDMPLPVDVTLPEDFGGFAIIINGHSLVHALTDKLEGLLLEVGCMCKSVICCRVTPLQKALVVDLVKRKKKCITLAIGDGANDVSMIKMAHIGVGISGQEGMQAVLASDFAIAQFRFLQQLLFVHGRYSYLRMCKFLRYFFYKNFAITMCQVWYSFWSGFSAQTLFDESFISLYNFCYTSLPVLALGMFDQDVSVADSMKYPRLYVPGPLNLLFNKRIFSYCIIEGIVSSLVLFFVPLGTFHLASRPDGLDLAGHKAFGFTIASILIVAVTLRCGLDTDYWTGFNHLSIWGSIAFYYLFTFAFYSSFFEYTYCGAAVVVMATANFWFSMILSCVVLLLPVMAERFLRIRRSPTLADRIRLHQKVKTRSKSAELTRKPKGLGRGQSFKRSGYAFAHQEGFGELITTGKNMAPDDRLRKESSLSSFAAVGRKVAEVMRPLVGGGKSRDDGSETPQSSGGGSKRSKSKENLLTATDSPASFAPPSTSRRSKSRENLLSSSESPSSTQQTTPARRSRSKENLVSESPSPPLSAPPPPARRSKSKENVLSSESPAVTTSSMKKNKSRDNVTFAEVHDDSPHRGEGAPLLADGQMPSMAITSEENGKKSKKARFKEPSLVGSAQDSPVSARQQQQAMWNETAI